ncbi:MULTISPECIES: MGMT family protein [Nocardiaceae]|uniref:MGMT family protein n=1 Tax=Rhodococcoides kroppenstedtii TaxID=293050 RepID=A0ABS7NS67_9NOCA|nr:MULTISPECIES: MGMT family protein [Rhodococcus]AMY17889.1 DNA base-flipping protein [Rhodococcus sp. PBTS 1]MBY6313154.1 MGMT family protein [Rhodococcus kroppenstedtii]MBY6320841.1 MGMT family protein [Rhodococcus kroppenstedtii]MBY6399744.1 MGMT family protein [Rhodococcus kroppenstedtii]MBY6438438.1 MGMT family protein [Rhodococcus kroppenstedtii]
MSEAREEFAERVLSVVERIPVGRVMTYGDIAEFLQQGGPRGVGGVMAREGAAVAWWRVVRANGTLPAHLVIDAQEHWHLERTPLRRGIVDVEGARWWPDSDRLAAR